MCKMKKQALLIALAIIFNFVFTSCGTMYSKFPKVSILTSKGIEFNNEIFYIINYKIYKRPEGIMKFPDGGLQKDLVNEYYIVKYKNIHNDNTKDNSVVYKLNIDKGLLKLESIKVFEKNDKIFFPIKYRVDKIVWEKAISRIERTWKEKLIVFNTKTDKTIVKTQDYKIENSYDNKNVKSIKATADLVRFIYDYNRLGLADPLNFMRLSDRNIRKVFLNDYLNGRMHFALIYYLIKNNKTELLDEIEKENTDKYISGEIRYFKEGWTTEQLKEYFKSIK